MSKLWLNNSILDRLVMLQQTEIRYSGINQIAIEKDWWVTVTLKALFQADCSESLIFKGGTSLSKGLTLSNAFRKTLIWLLVIRSLVLRKRARTNVKSCVKQHVPIFTKYFLRN